MGYVPSWNRLSNFFMETTDDLKRTVSVFFTNGQEGKVI
jgi:hypothetical protein